MSNNRSVNRKALIFIALQYIAALAVTIFITTELSTVYEFLQNLLFYSCILVAPVLFFIGIVYKVNPFIYLEMKPKIKPMVAGLAAGAGMALIFLVSNKFEVKNAFSFETSWLLLLAGGVLAGIFEEIVFRGFYFKFFRSRLGFIWADIITAVLFSLLHLGQIPEHGVIQIVMLFILALLLGYAYEKSKSLWVPIIIHITYNILIFLFR